jgi:CelD/BcsL family acetyltransferase involved in cellulose biosynthesis
MHSRDLFAGAAPRRAVAVRVDEISDLGALDREAWDALVASAPDSTVFQCFDWLVSWWEAFGGRRRALVLIAQRDNDLVGAAPLFIDDTFGQPCIRFIGENHADYLTFLARNGAAEVVEQLLDHLERCYSAQHDINLVDVPEISALGLLLERRQKAAPLRVLRTKVTPCPRLRLKDNDEQVEGVLKKKSLKRHAAKLAAQGAVEVRHLTDAREILVQLEHFFEQHRRRWAVTPFPSLFEAEPDRRFYRNLVKSRFCDRCLMLTTVSIGTRLVACHFGLISRADFLWYKPSFDVTLSQLSPGEVLLRELLLLARERGFEYFDFTRGDEAFKSRFSTEVRYNATYLVYASRVDALAAHIRAFAMGVLRRRLSQSSSTGRFLRQVKQAFTAARLAGAGLPKAAVASLWLTGEGCRRWLISRRAVHLFIAQESPPVGTDQGHRVREANLEYLLEGSNRLDEMLAFNQQFLVDAHKRLAQGERCFVMEDQERVVAVGWVNPRSPHPVTETEAVLRFPEHAVVLYDFHIVKSSRGLGLYPQLLTGIRFALGAVPALIYAEDWNVASLRGIRRAGFTLEAVIENRTLFGHRRLTWRLSRGQSISWEIIRRAAQPSPATMP